MPKRRIEIDGRTWYAFPSGFITQYDADEFGVEFVHGTGDTREVRVTRYSPVGARSREQSLADLTDAELKELFVMSQSSVRSPEAGYAS
ncbi:MAG TPA: hypothetical protein VM764_10425 [Gemmatimonadaceae bacterium]|jgi:hypothetical protein|nr:hypothetical protein [Gemmatimonadaceae bacterium]